jgi:hypothetical protein
MKWGDGVEDALKRLTEADSERRVGVLVRPLPHPVTSKKEQQTDGEL